MQVKMNKLDKKLLPSFDYPDPDEFAVATVKDDEDTPCMHCKYRSGSGSVMRDLEQASEMTCSECIRVAIFLPSLKQLLLVLACHHATFQYE